MAKRSTSVYGAIAAACEVGISLRQLYYWVQVLHVARPCMEQHGRRQFARFLAKDVNALKKVKRLMERGYTLQAAARKVKTARRSS